MQSLDRIYALPFQNSGLTRTRLLTAACTAATGTDRSGMAFPSTSPSSCMMTRWEICWATGSRMLSMVLVWNTGIVNDFQHSPGGGKKKAAGSSSADDLLFPLSPSPLLRGDRHRAVSPALWEESCLRSWVSWWKLDSSGRCPPVGATQIVTEGITALQPIRAKEYSCQAAWCALTLSLYAHTQQTRALPKLRHACQCTLKGKCWGNLMSLDEKSLKF